jgi:1,4-dihydroxy-2-naphthoyl-CoA hydrolase
MPADLDALVALMPFAGHLGLILDEAGPDRVTARLEWAPHLCTSGGLMHGGVLMSLADTAGALVTFLGLPEGATTATITSTSQMFRPVGGQLVRFRSAPGRPDHADPGGQGAVTCGSRQRRRRAARPHLVSARRSVPRGVR